MLNRRELLGAASVLALSPGAAWAQAKNAADVAVESAKKYAGTEINEDGKDYLIMKQSDILAILEK